MSKEIFTSYYKKNTWKGKESVSGPGSDYEQTRFLIPELQILLKDLEIKSMLDIPCGDFNWMQRVNLDGIKYYGADIVTELIENNTKVYSKNNIKFSVIDVICDTLPKVDLIMVRDCFVHLPNNDVLKSLNNIKSSGSKYLLTTNFTWEHFKYNNDIEHGQWRRLNMSKDPFNLKPPQKSIVEGNTQSNDRDKSMGLWLIEDIPHFSIKE